MKENLIVKAENVSKKYCKSLKRSMIYGIQDIVKNTFNFSAKLKDLRKDEFWAVRKVNFSLKRGETLGIIGSNGSGKSTLLKMLNGIFWPDEGMITIKGKVGALIEVGAGFHPMLSGRENVYLNGAILGMKKREIEKKFDQIVEFAEIGEFIDTPVKFYSSGMFVRLGFSIAVHSDPDILLVDEILSVGDLNFQAKSKKKIVELLERGISIILVSHNLNLINTVCDQTLFLDKSLGCYLGNTSDIIDKYRDSFFKEKKKAKSFGTNEIVINSVKAYDKNSGESMEFNTNEKMIIEIFYSVNKEVKDPVFSIAIFNVDGTQITGIRSDIGGVNSGIIKSDGSVKLILDKLPLMPGFYSVTANILDKTRVTFYSRIFNVFRFKVLGGMKDYGYVDFPHKWELK